MSSKRPHQNTHPEFHASSSWNDSSDPSLQVARMELASQRRKILDGIVFSGVRGCWFELIESIFIHFCPVFAPGGAVLYIGDTGNNFIHLETATLAALGVTLDAAANIPYVIVHDTERNWLFLIEAVTCEAPLDAKRRQEVEELFGGCDAGLIFIAAFQNFRTLKKFISKIAWESEVWIAEEPHHMIHFNGRRFLGPYP